MKLIIPEKILEQHLVVLGKTGAGKSSALRHIVEHLLTHKKRVCIIDPKGDWWGLKYSADGKSEGFPVIAFGDFKESKAADIPLNAQSGKHVAELIASGNRPAIIGFRGWMTAHMVKFWIDFAATLFSHNSGELYLVGDEFHHFAPKGKIQDIEAGKCLHWSNRLMSEGRGLGIVCLIASQRPQKVHNDTLTSCETLVAMRVIHKSDRDAVKDWIEGCGDINQGKEVLNSLAGMNRGEAHVWSPEAGYGPKFVTFPMFETFDSFAPPQLQKKINASGWSNVDLDEVKAKLANVIEEQKANDPAELKRTVADLKRKLHQAEQKKPEVERKEIETPVFDAACRDLLASVEKACNDVLRETQKRAEDFRLIQVWLASARERLERTALRQQSGGIRRPAPAQGLLHAEKLAPTGRSAAVNGDLRLNSVQQRILDALAWLESIGNTEPKNVQVGAVALIDSTGGYFSNMVSPLSAGGLVNRLAGRLSLTDAGREIAKVPERVASMDEYHEHLRKRIVKLKSAGGPTIKILDAIIARAGADVTVAEIGEEVGIDHTGGYFSNMISPLGGIGLIERDRGVVRPTEVLFPPGLK